MSSSSGAAQSSKTKIQTKTFHFFLPFLRQHGETFCFHSSFLDIMAQGLKVTSSCEVQQTSQTIILRPKATPRAAVRSFPMVQACWEGTVHTQVLRECEENQRFMDNGMLVNIRMTHHCSHIQ